MAMSSRQGRVEAVLRVQDHDEGLEMHTLIGRRLRLVYEKSIRCLNCNRAISKTYGDGFCFPCFQELPQCAACVIRPELCTAHTDNPGKHADWERANHNQPHVVYLAYTGAIKVGVTRAPQVPTRWLDQGATQSGVLCEVPYRALAGEMERYYKQFVSDKTDWRAMLQQMHDNGKVGMEQELVEMRGLLPDEWQAYASHKADLYSFVYPGQAIESSPKSLALTDALSEEMELTGIRGQYLLFNNQLAFNVRRHAGYVVSFELI